MSRSRRVAVVGGGPRLVYLLDSLDKTEHDLRHLDLVVFDNSDQPGAGHVHAPTLPRLLRMNRRADQLSFGPDPTCSGWSNLACGADTLSDYVDAHGLHDELVDGYPTRRVHGAALAARFADLLGRLRTRITIHLRHEHVRDVEVQPGEAIVATDRAALVADEVLLLTGHGAEQAVPPLGSPLDGPLRFRGLGATSIDYANVVADAHGQDRVGRLVEIRSESGVLPWARPVAGGPVNRAPVYLSRIDPRTRPSFHHDVLPAVFVELLSAFLHWTSAEGAKARVDLADDWRWCEAIWAYLSARPDPTAVMNGLADHLSGRDRAPVPEELRPNARQRIALKAFPWEALELLLDPRQHAPRHSAMQDGRRQLIRAYQGHGNSAAVTAFELVLRDHRPLLCALTSPDVMSGRDREAAFTCLVPAMNRLVNGPAPDTLATFLHHCDRGAVAVVDEFTDTTSPAIDAYIRVDDPRRNLVATLADKNYARPGITYGQGDRTQYRVEVDTDMTLTGTAAQGRVAAIGPSVDNGELLHASAMRPGVNHTVMRDITRWLEGLARRTAHRPPPTRAGREPTTSITSAAST